MPSDFSVTVLIPAYNEATRIGKTIESVLAQTVKPKEILVIDDGSTDKTADVAATYPGVQVIRQLNGGISASRNRGLRAATGEWVALLDADDLWLPNRLEWLVRAAARFPGSDFGFSDYTVQDVTGAQTSDSNLCRSSQYLKARGDERSDISLVLRTPLCKAIAFGNFIGTSTVFVRQDFVRRHALWFDEDLPKRTLEYQLSEDAEWYLRVLRYTDAVVIDRVLARYVLRDGSQSSSLGRVRYGDFKLGELVHSMPYLYGPGTAAAFKLLRREHLVRSAKDHMRLAEFKPAFDRFTQAQEERYDPKDAVLQAAVRILDNDAGRSAMRVARTTWQRSVRPFIRSLSRGSADK